MGNILIGTPNWSEFATVTAAVETSAGPASNLARMRPSEVWETDDLTQIQLDLDRGERAVFTFVALLHTNATVDATWRVRASDTLANLTAAPLLDTSGGFGSGLRFTGSERAVTLSSMDFDPAELTIELYVKPSQTRRQGIVALTDSGESPVLVVGTDATGRLRLLDVAGGQALVTAPSPLPVEAWSAVAARFESAGGGTATLFVDGSPVASQAGLGALPTGRRHFEMAGRDVERLDGDLDDVRFWNVARTDAEIADAVGAEYPAGGARPLRYWKLNDGSGAIAADEEGNGAIFLDSPQPTWVYPDRFWVSSDLAGWETAPAFLFQKVGYYARYLRIEVLDAGNPDMAFRAGRLMVGSGWQPQKNAKYGMVPFGFEDLSRRTYSADGSLDVGENPKRNHMEFTISFEDEHDLYQNAYELDWRRGSSRDVFVVVDPEAEFYRAQKMIHGTLAPGRQRPRHSAFSYFEHRYAVEGLV